MKNCANRMPSALWRDLKGSGWLIIAELNGCLILAKGDACCFHSYAELRSKQFDFNRLPQTHTNFSDRENYKCGSEIKDEGALIDVASLLASFVNCLCWAIRNIFVIWSFCRSFSMSDRCFMSHLQHHPKTTQNKNNFIYSSKTGIIRALREPQKSKSNAKKLRFI